MGKVLLGGLLFCSLFPALAEDIKISKISEISCYDSEDKMACKRVVDLSLAKVFVDGRASAFCDFLKDQSSGIPSDHAEHCELMNEMKKEAGQLAAKY